MNNNTSRPSRKANSTTTYINVNSDHPPVIIRAIPKIVEDRISTLCSNEDVHSAEKNFFENVLRSGVLCGCTIERQNSITDS